jgi:hypothetical protein
MRFIEAFSHHNGENEWQKRDLFEWVTDVFELPNLVIGKGTTTTIRSHIRQKFEEEGWSDEVRISADHDLSVFSMKNDLAFQVQTGNVSRAFYDLLKIQYLYSCEKIEAAALAVPTTKAAQKIGSNIAYFERIMNELNLFNRVITVPLLLISFE